MYTTFAKDLARASSEIIMFYYRRNLHMENKTNGTPVTIADREAEQIMRQMIMKTFPEHGIIGEEFGVYQPQAAYQWVLDPIDGTINYVAGSFLFGTMIALLHHNKPVLGIIHHPLSQHLLIGTPEGTHLNGDPVRVHTCYTLDEATICSTSHCEVKQHHDFEAFQRLICRAQTYRTWGDCHGYYLLATGGADIMLDPIMHIWDVAALVPIVEGAGGRITDWTGGDPLAGSSIVATNGLLHDEVLRALNPVQDAEKRF